MNISCIALVQIWALVAYVSLICVLATGILLDIVSINPRIKTNIRIYIHSVLGIILILASIFHIYYLNCTTFDFRKLYDPLNYFDILALSGFIAFFMLIFVQLTSFFRRYMNKFWWNNLHNLSYLAYLFVSVHAYFKGDRTFEIVSIISLVLLLVLFLIRWKKGNNLFY